MGICLSLLEPALPKEGIGCAQSGNSSVTNRAVVIHTIPIKIRYLNWNPLPQSGNCSVTYRAFATQTIPIRNATSIGILFSQLGYHRSPPHFREPLGDNTCIMSHERLITLHIILYTALSKVERNASNSDKNILFVVL